MYKGVDTPSKSNRSRTNACGSNTVYYMVSTGSTQHLKDQLSSASVVTSSSGVTVGEQRYYPYGETRISTGTIFTDKLFTGQRDTGLGIYDFHARMYSPKLGRFISADTIGVSYGNPQTLNRYSYVLNDPILYTDPTGHTSCSGTNWDDGPSCFTDAKIDSNLKGFGVTTSGFDHKHKLAILQAVHDVGDNLMRHNKGGSAESAFHKVYKDGVNFKQEGSAGFCQNIAADAGGCTDSANQIRFWSMSNDVVKNVVHELGHAFYHAVGNAVGYPLLGDNFSRKALIRNGSYANGEALVWEQHPISMNKPKEDIATELFADTFLAWTYDTWNSNPEFALTVSKAQNEMDRIASSIP